MFLRKIAALVCAFCLVSSISSVAYAFANKNSKEPVNITSDSATVNNKTGESVFIGNVKIDQGDSHLTADRVVVKMNADNKILSAIATGVPAVYRTRTAPNKPEVVAKASKLEYLADQGKIYLIGDAVVTQEQNVFKGPRIEYDINSELVTSTSSNKGRTQIVIVPNK